jgi:hypothetical protein
LAFSYWTDKPWFLIEGKLAAVLITPSLGVPNWSVIYIINTTPSTYCGGRRRPISTPSYKPRDEARIHSKAAKSYHDAESVVDAGD